MLFEGLIVCERKLLRLKSRSVGFLAATSFTDCLREVEPEGKKNLQGKNKILLIRITIKHQDVATKFLPQRSWCFLIV